MDTTATKRERALSWAREAKARMRKPKKGTPPSEEIIREARDRR